MARRPHISSAKIAKAAPRRAPSKLSEDAKGLLDAANESSNAARNAWLGFLALVTYLLVTLGGVSHKDLLLNSGVTLPIVNVKIPLFSFFQYAPLLLLLVLLSLLIQHVVLARKYWRFVEAIAPYERRAGKEHPARELVHSYVAAQLLAGPKRNPVTRSMMRLMVFVTFALLPVLTLLYFQIKFVPYHEVWVTYWHRIMVLLGLAMLFALLPIIQLKSRKRVVELGPQGEAWRASPFGIASGVAIAILVIGFSWLIATIPDEGLDRRLGFIPPAGPNERSDEELLNPLVRLAYDKIPQAEKPEDRGWLLRRLVSYRVLVVEDEDLVPDEIHETKEVSRVLRGREFRFARLSRSDLHRADLTKADLRGAQMRQTRLEKAKLPFAQLQRADLHRAQLQGANLEQAELQGADLSEAKLQGAHLNFAELQDATLYGAQLQGADLSVAQLQGANLLSANLRGADLFNAQLQGADLSEAQLLGADLWSAELQGADLSDAQLQGADLQEVDVWLASFPDDFANQSPAPLDVAHLHLSPPTTKAKAYIKKSLQASITDEQWLAKLIDRLDPILRDDPPEWKDEDKWHQYVNQATEPPPDELVPFLAEMACGDRGGHIANSMAQRAVRYSKDEGRRHYAKPLAAALLCENCEGAKGLSNETRAELQDIVAAPE